MDLQKMLSKISPDQLQQGMKQLGLNQEQMSQVNNMVKGGNTNGNMNNINMNDVNEMLKNNPDLAKQVKQFEMLSKFNEIFGK